MRRAVGIALFVVALAALLFILAGRWDWWPGWAFLVVAVGGVGTTSLLLARHDPELLERRSHLAKGTEPADRLFLTVFALSFFAVLIVAPLDAARFGWAPLPAWSAGLGTVLFLVGEALVSWAMLTNTFFEKTVRLQTDRGHRTITTGPYAFVRHPGYTGFLIGYALGFPLMLTSSWALMPAAIAALSVIVRTRFEDDFLAEKLAGYADYRGKVRHRLIPGIW